MDRLPQEIYDAIATYFSDAWNPEPILLDRASLATVSRKWQAAMERRNFEQIQLNSTPFDLEHFQNIIRRDRRRFVKKIFYSIKLPNYNEEDRGQFEREADRMHNNQAFTVALQNLFTILASWGDGFHWNDRRAGDNTDSWIGRPVTIVVQDISSPADAPQGRRVRFPDERPLGYRFEDQPGLQFSTVGQALGLSDQPPPRDLGRRRYQYSFLNLQQGICLPIVPAIGLLLIDTSQSRKVSPEAVAEITAKLPNLDSIKLDLQEPGERYPAFRRVFRDSLTRAIKKMPLPKRPSILRLRNNKPALKNNFWRPADVLPVGAKCDPVGLALREITAHDPWLKTLHITDTIDPSLLWPDALSADQIPQPFWQNLQTLYIEFDITTPSGGWYFKISDEATDLPWLSERNFAASDIDFPPGYGHSKAEDMMAAMVFDEYEEAQLSGSIMSYRKRTVPDNKQLVPLIGAFAKACAQMPKLKQACLSTAIWSKLDRRPSNEEDVEEETGLYRHTLSDWGIYYAAPSPDKRTFWHKNLSSYFAKQREQRRLVLDVRDWRPPQELANLLKEIGREAFGGKLVETFVDTWASTVMPQRLRERHRE